MDFTTLARFSNKNKIRAEFVNSNVRNRISMLAKPQLPRVIWKPNIAGFYTAIQLVNQVHKEHKGIQIIVCFGHESQTGPTRMWLLWHSSIKSIRNKSCE